MDDLSEFDLMNMDNDEFLTHLNNRQNEVDDDSNEM